MAVFKLPTRVDVPEFSYSLELEGTSFQLVYRWNERARLWHLDVLDAVGGELLLGLPLVVGYPLLADYRNHLGLPAGDFVVVDMRGESGRPGRTEWDVRYQVLYYEAVDVAAARAGD